MLQKQSSLAVLARAYVSFLGKTGAEAKHCERRIITCAIRGTGESFAGKHATASFSMVPRYFRK